MEKNNENNIINDTICKENLTFILILNYSKNYSYFNNYKRMNKNNFN